MERKISGMSSTQFMVPGLIDREVFFFFVICGIVRLTVVISSRFNML